MENVEIDPSLEINFDYRQKNVAASGLKVIDFYRYSVSGCIAWQFDIIPIRL